MKILILTLEYPPQVGGIASYVYNLAAHLPSEEVAVYAPRLPRANVKVDSAPWQVVRGSLLAAWCWPRWLPLVIRLIRLAQREKITHVYVEQVLPLGYAAYILKLWRQIPYTIFLHGTDVARSQRLNKRFQFRFLCREADRVVVNSQFLKQKLLSQAAGLPAVTVLYPGPGDQFLDEPDLLAVEELRRRLALAGKRVMLTVGRMVEGKGFPHLVRLIPKMLKAVPQLVWVVVGDGPKAPGLVAAVAKAGLQNVVRWVGLVPYAALPNYYRLADVFVLLTHPDQEAEEGWGTVFLEAAASSIPVVAGRVGGVEEAVEHGRTGLIVDVYQDQAVVGTVVEILKNEALRRELGRAAEERVRREFTWAKQLAKLARPNEESV